MLNLAKYIFLICLTVFFGNRAIANSYWCEVVENSYLAAAGIAKISVKEVKNWMPSVFSVGPTEAQFWSDGPVKVTGGNRTTTFQTNDVRGAFRYNYNVKIDPYSNTATLYLKSPGYHTVGPVRYTCEATKISKPASVSNRDSELKNEFQKLSQCNKKYLQQFLKGQGLYFGGIDGRWGNGTNKAVSAALKLPTFKNMLPNAFFKKIQQNPICN